MSLSISYLSRYALAFTAALAIALVPARFTIAQTSTVLFSDGFESGDTSEWDESSEGWDVVSADAFAGEYKARASNPFNDEESDVIEHDSLVAEVNTEGYEDLELTFHYKTTDFEPDDTFFVQIKTAEDDEWSTIASYSDGDEASEWSEESLYLSTTTANNEGLALRFISYLDSDADQFHLDEVSLTGAEIDDEEDEGTEDEAGEEDPVVINVMKHICDEDVQSVEDFESVDGPDDNDTTEFHDKVLACPTVIMPGDEYTSGAVHFDGKRNFDFDIVDADGDVIDIADAVFDQRQICEDDIGVDVNGDGELSACLDTSLYVFDDISSGNVSVTETMTPGNTRSGALEFTPNALNPNNDAETLLEEMNEVFEDDDTIELDTTKDDNGVITLHVYNFVNEEEDEDDDAESNELLSVIEQILHSFEPGGSDVELHLDLDATTKDGVIERLSFLLGILETKIEVLLVENGTDDDEDENEDDEDENGTDDENGNNEDEDDDDNGSDNENDNKNIAGDIMAINVYHYDGYVGVEVDTTEAFEWFELEDASSEDEVIERVADHLGISEDEVEDVISFDPDEEEKDETDEDPNGYVQAITAYVYDSSTSVEIDTDVSTNWIELDTTDEDEIADEIADHLDRTEAEIEELLVIE